MNEKNKIEVAAKTTSHSDTATKRKRTAQSSANESNRKWGDRGKATGGNLAETSVKETTYNIAQSAQIAEGKPEDASTSSVVIAQIADDNPNDAVGTSKSNYRKTSDGRMLPVQQRNL